MTIETITREKAREFKKLHIEFVSLVFSPKSPANRESVILRADDPGRADYTLEVPIERYDESLDVAYCILYAPENVDTEQTWAGRRIIREAMEGIMRERRTLHVDRNHDYSGNGDHGFLCEVWEVRAGDPLFPDPKKVGACAIGVKLTNEQDKADAKAGKLKGVSLAGHAVLGAEAEVAFTSTERAKWSTKYVDDLPDSSFAYVKDGERKLPYKDADGNVDLPHLRNALARLDQADGISDTEKARIRKKLEGILEKENAKMEKTEKGAAEQPLGAEEIGLVRRVLRAVGLAGVQRGEFNDTVEKDRVMRLLYTLQETVNRIYCDEAIEDKNAAIVDSIKEFTVAVQSRSTEKTERAGRVLSKKNLESLKGMRKSLDDLIAQAGEEGAEKTEKTNQEGKDMDQKQAQELIDRAVQPLSEKIDRVMAALTKAPEPPAPGAAGPQAAPGAAAPQGAVDPVKRVADLEAKVVELTQKLEALGKQTPQEPTAEALRTQIDAAERQIKEQREQIQRTEEQIKEQRARLEKLEGARPAAAGAGGEGTTGQPAKRSSKGLMASSL